MLPLKKLNMVLGLTYDASSPGFRYDTGQMLHWFSRVLLAHSEKGLE